VKPEQAARGPTRCIPCAAARGVAGVREVAPLARGDRAPASAVEPQHVAAGVGQRRWQRLHRGGLRLPRIVVAVLDRIPLLRPRGDVAARQRRHRCVARVHGPAASGSRVGPVLRSDRELSALEPDLGIGRVHAVHEQHHVKVPRGVDGGLHRAEWSLLTPVAVRVVTLRGHKEPRAPNPRQQAGRRDRRHEPRRRASALRPHSDHLRVCLLLMGAPFVRYNNRQSLLQNEFSRCDLQRCIKPIA